MGLVGGRVGGPGLRRTRRRPDPTSTEGQSKVVGAGGEWGRHDVRGRRGHWCRGPGGESSMANHEGRARSQIAGPARGTDAAQCQDNGGRGGRTTPRGAKNPERPKTVISRAGASAQRAGAGPKTRARSGR